MEAPAGPVITQAGRLALAAAAAVAVGSWLLTAAAHVDDAFAIDHVAGTWLALAAETASGRFYPPLHEGGAFGGTRFMPLPVALDGAAAWLADDVLVATKLVSYAAAAGLVAVTFAVLRRLGASTPVAAFFAGTLLVSGTGLVAATSVRNDALPALLGVAAVGAVARSTERRVVLLAAGLCAAALLAKLSAVWAPLAIAGWLLARDRRRLAPFVGAYVALAAGGLALAELASHGRFGENLVSLAFAGSPGGWETTVDRLRLIGREGLGWLAVLPVLAAALVGWRAARRRTSLLDAAFVAGCVVTGVVLLDPGAFVNHLLDVQVLSLLVVGTAVAETRPGLPRGAAAGLLALLVVAAAHEYRANVRPGRDARLLLEGRTRPVDAVPRLAGALPAGEVLSEDPFVPVSRGERPVVLDPFMLRRLLERHPGWRRELVARIDRREFAAVVLLFRAEEATDWYRRLHFGTPVVEAITAAYRPGRQVDGLWIYVPR